MRFIFFFIFLTVLKNRKVLKETFNTLNLNCQNDKMIHIKCVNKKKTEFSSKIYAGKENCTKNFLSLFQTFFFHKQIKNLGGRSENLPPHFFYLLIHCIL